MGSRLRLTLAGLALGLLVGGCADMQQTASRFTPGVTTRADALAALGAPSSIYEAANGDRTLSWARDGGVFDPSDTRQLALVFGPDDKLVRIAAEPGKAP
jgi:hypothetical protein